MSATDALTNALVLALTAPDQARADRAIALARQEAEVRERLAELYPGTARASRAAS